MRRYLALAAGLLCAAGLPQLVAADAGHERAARVAGHLGTVAHYLQTKPEMVLDFTRVSGEYCLNTWLAGGSHMTHYAVDPTGTREDVIDFVQAGSLAEAGINVEDLPRFPGGLGTMEPGVWYYLPAGELEPHHGKSFPVPLLIRASDIE